MTHNDDRKVLDKLLKRHDGRPMCALYEVLTDASHGVELPMAIIMDPLCGIERRAEEEDMERFLVGATPLLFAIYTERLDVAKALLAAGADPYAKAANGCSSLILTAREGNLEATELLISYGADINAVDNNGKTALHHAAGWGGASVVELLDRAGPNLEAVDKKGRTALSYATSSNDAGAIKALLL